MANQEHLEKLKEGVEAWNKWREKYPDLEPDLQGASLMGTQLPGADLSSAQLQGAVLSYPPFEADLSSANLSDAYLQGAVLSGAYLQGADLSGAYLQGVDLSGAQLQGAVLSGAFFDNTTKLNRADLGDGKEEYASLADINWGGVNLAVVDWSELKMLGDEYRARQPRSAEGMVDNEYRAMQPTGSIEEIEDWARQPKRIKKRAEKFSLRTKARLRTKYTLILYREAVRANRQLAVALRNQGLNEEADHYAYRAQLCQRVIWRWQGRPLKYILSWFLFLLAGYGYRPLRSLLWYIAVILGFAIAYYVLGHITPLEAFVLSLTSFHGRGFFPGTNITLSDPRVVLAAFEAVIGLFIEISFIATFTQRFFGR